MILKKNEKAKNCCFINTYILIHGRALVHSLQCHLQAEERIGLLGGGQSGQLEAATLGGHGPGGKGGHLPQRRLADVQLGGGSCGRRRGLGRR